MAITLANFEDKRRRFSPRSPSSGTRLEVRWYEIPVDQVSTYQPAEGTAMDGSSAPLGYTVQRVSPRSSRRPGMQWLIITFEYQLQYGDIL